MSRKAAPSAGLLNDAARVRAAGEQRVGGKAMGLARLSELGAHVPAWLVIPSEAFTAHVEGARVQPLSADEQQHLKSAELQALVAAADARMRAIIAVPLAKPLVAGIERLLPKLGPGPYAVRSSMSGEDSQQRSFAGQLDTFLSLHTADEVAGAVVGCWASAFSARALHYQMQDGGGTTLPRMAVVVQQMATGDVSGVLFTAHPVNGRRDQALLTAAWGLGEGVVSGRCNADEFVWAHEGGEVSVSIADKDQQIVPALAGGTQETVVPEAKRQVRCLTPAQVKEVCEEGLRIARALGSPQDIEWTFAGGTLHILQARPITTLSQTGSPRATPAYGITTAGAAVASVHTAPTRPAISAGAAASPASGPRVVWDNSNIQESYCGVTTPLTFSFACMAYASVYEQFLRTVGLPRHTIVAYRPVVRQLLGLVRGRVYYNINNWYRLLLVFPGFGRNKHDMEKMMGLTEPVDFVESQVLSVWEKLRRLPRLLLTALRLNWRFLFLERDVNQFLYDFEEAYARVDRKELQGASLSRLMEIRAQLYHDMLENWYTPIVNDFRVMVASGKLRRLAEEAMGDSAASTVAALMAGEEGIESTEPTRMLLSMAKEARGDPQLQAALQNGTPQEAWAALQAFYPEFFTHLARYIERYGDRCMGELKLETISLREEPSFVIQVLRNFVDRADLDPDLLSAKEKQARAEAEQALAGKLSFRGRRKLAGALKAARAAVKFRENMRLSRTRGFGLYRDLHLGIGARLHEAGRLDEARDIFYLTVQEIEGYFDGTGVAADLASLARARKAEFARYQHIDLPHRFETRGAALDESALVAEAKVKVDPATAVLRGTGCYPGVAEAQARVIMSPHDDLSLNGKILVTLRTDPGWAPLFPSASGILVERGSTLSHSAILARELGIPAIVGVPHLLQLVRDGERLRMNGGNGTIERLDAGSHR